MASMNDARDIMGLQPGESLPKPPPAKKQKTSQPKPRVTGINREVQALYGERAPPVAVVEAGKSYQPKRRWGANKGPAARWKMMPFTNPARADGLILRHWRRAQPSDSAAANGDVVMENTENQELTPVLETNYEYAKFNVQPEGPEYDDETYEAHLRSEDWSKEETDYLVETVKEYYHRWTIVADRYEFKPTQPKPEPGTEDAIALPAAVPKPRTMEDMKARYYQISAKLMELKTPIASMTNAEFGLHEVLTKFDADRERQRKKVASALLERTADEIMEEQYLLGELQRINTNYEKLSAEREEVRQRLSAPQTQGGTPSTAQFQSSHALSQLFNQLLQQDRSKKRNGRLSLNTADQISTPSGQQTPMTAGHRDSLASATGAGANKRASLSAGQQGGAANTQQAQQPQPPRTLTPRAMARLGVTHHDRLSSGVTFKSDRLHKLRMAKSTIQTQKIQQALMELRIPEIIALPTADVCDAFEGLINKIHKLLDLRKLLEKEEAEVAVAEGVRAERLRRERIERGEDPDADADGDDADGDGDADADADGEVDADGEADESAVGGGEKREADGDAVMGDAPPTADGDADMKDATTNGDAGGGANGVVKAEEGEDGDAAGQKRSASVVSGGSASGKRNRK